MTTENPSVCAECATPFYRGQFSLSANPRSESCVHPGMCKRCSAAILAQMDPPMSFPEMLARCWDTDPNYRPADLVDVLGSKEPSNAPS